MSWLKAAIFDLDDTLIYTREAHFLAYREACKSIGLELEYEKYTQCLGQDSRIFLKSIFSQLPQSLILKIRKEKSLCFSKYLDRTSVNQPILGLAIQISRSAQIAIVTNAKKQNCFEMLSYHKLHEMFDFVVDGDSIKNPKPSPDGYLKALKLMNVKPESTIAFEDSDSGIMAAKSADVQVLKVV